MTLLRTACAPLALGLGAKRHAIPRTPRACLMPLRPPGSAAGGPARREAIPEIRGGEAIPRGLLIFLRIFEVGGSVHIPVQAATQIECLYKDLEGIARRIAVTPKPIAHATPRVLQ